MAASKKKVDAPARRLRLGLPKGSLQATTEKLFTLAASICGSASAPTTPTSTIPTSSAC
jgi:hypothetical protein